MCGIAGYIGRSNNPRLSYQVLTSLFERAELRGTDASGYWMSEYGPKGRVICHKQPGRSSEYVKSAAWTNNSGVDANLAIVHARGASRGSGSPTVNKNNHPFVSESGNIALVHNGRIDSVEYDELVRKYKVKSQCDSEVLLRIFEQAAHIYSDEYVESYVGDCGHKRRVAGIKDIFSLVNHGHMAVAIGEWLRDNERSLWLFRNEHRPLWVSDARECLGQIFFFSDPSMWRHAVAATDQSLRRCKTMEVPEYEVWHLTVNEESQRSGPPVRYAVSKSDPKPWKNDGVSLEIPRDDVELEVVAMFSQEDSPDSEDEDGSDRLLSEIERKIEKIQTSCRNIYALSQIMLRSRSIAPNEVEHVISLLDEQQKSFSEIENIFD